MDQSSPSQAFQSAIVSACRLVAQIATIHKVEGLEGVLVASAFGYQSLLAQSGNTVYIDGNLSVQGDVDMATGLFAAIQIDRHARRIIQTAVRLAQDPASQESWFDWLTNAYDDMLAKFSDIKGDRGAAFEIGYALQLIRQAVAVHDVSGGWAGNPPVAIDATTSWNGLTQLVDMIHRNKEQGEAAAAATVPFLGQHMVSLMQHLSHSSGIVYPGFSGQGFQRPAPSVYTRTGDDQGFRRGY